jgi:hypothetical protein
LHTANIPNMHIYKRKIFTGFPSRRVWKKGNIQKIKKRKLIFEKYNIAVVKNFVSFHARFSLKESSFVSK